MKKFIIYFWKRPLLTIGSALLIITWRLERYEIVEYEKDIQKAWRQHDDFEYSLQLTKLSTLECDVLRSFRNIKDSSVSLLKLCEAISNQILARNSLIFAGKVMKNELNDAYRIQAEMEIIKDSLGGLIQRQNLDSLEFVNEAATKLSTKYHIADQKAFNQYIIDKNKNLDKWEIIYNWAYGIGIFLLAMRKWRIDRIDEKEKKELKDMISTIYNKKK